MQSNMRLCTAMARVVGILLCIAPMLFILPQIEESLYNFFNNMHIIVGKNQTNISNIYRQPSQRNPSHDDQAIQQSEVISSGDQSRLQNPEKSASQASIVNGKMTTGSQDGQRVRVPEHVEEKNPHSVVDCCTFSPEKAWNNSVCLQKLYEKKKSRLGERTQGRLLMFGDSTMKRLSVSSELNTGLIKGALQTLQRCYPKYRCERISGNSAVVTWS